MKLTRFSPHISGDDKKNAMKFQRGLRPSTCARMTTLRLSIFTDVETTIVIERESEKLHYILDRGKKHPSQDGFRKTSDNAKTFKK